MVKSKWDSKYGPPGYKAFDSGIKIIRVNPAHNWNVMALFIAKHIHLTVEIKEKN